MSPLGLPSLDRVAADTSALPPLRADLVVLNELPETLGRLASRVPGQKKS
jgi:hypothetical protein